MLIQAENLAIDSTKAFHFMPVEAVSLRRGNDSTLLEISKVKKGNGIQFINQGSVNLIKELVHK